MTSSNRAFSAAVLSVSMLMPMFALAAEPAVQRARVQAETRVGSGDAFCTRVAAASTETNSRIGTMRKDVASNREQRDDRMEGKEAARKSKIESIAIKQTTHLAEVAGRLNEAADTDEEKVAVTTFQSAVQAAVTARRAAVQSANDTFKAGIQAAIVKRKTSLDAAATMFETSMKAALDKAKTDCVVTGADSAAIRTTYMASVKAAKDKLMAARVAADKVSDATKPLIAAHRAALDKAQADFKAALEKAKTDLKASMETEESEPTNANSAQ